MKRIVSEDFGDFLKEELNPEEIGVEIDPDDASIDISGMPDMEEEEVVTEDQKDEIKRILKNELSIPEFSRETIIFKLKRGEEIQGIPMAEFPSGNTFVIKVEGKNQKIKIEDIVDIDQVFESVNEEITSDKFSFTDYMFAISDFIKTEVPDWDILIGEEETDLIDWIEKNQDLWDLQSLYEAGITPEDASIQIMEEIQAIEEEE